INLADSIDTLWRNTRDGMNAIEEHNEISLEIVAESLCNAVDSSIHPIFQIFFSHFSNHQILSFDGAHLEPLDDSLLAHRGSKFDLSLATSETSSDINFVWEWNSDLFNDATIYSMHRTLVRSIEMMLLDDAISLDNIRFEP